MTARLYLYGLDLWLELWAILCAEMICRASINIEQYATMTELTTTEGVGDLYLRAPTGHIVEGDSRSDRGNT